jgi:ribosomal protein S18 acetylase RimI-like enzyme
MGVTPALRHQKVGHQLMVHAIEDAGNSGFRSMTLEVIETNQHARSLYEHLGFREVRTLVGYEREPGNLPAPSEDRLQEIDPGELAKVIEYEGPNNLPWQLAAETIVNHTPPSIALKLGDKAYVMVAAVTDRMVVLGGMVVPHALRRHGWGRRMIDALIRRYPQRTLRFPARMPENLAPDFFLEAGFRKAALAQKELVLDLPTPPS